MSDSVKNVVAFDYGASSGRAVLGSFDGEKIKLCELHRFTNDPVNVRGTLYWDVLRLFHEMKQGLIAAKAHGKIASVGVDTWGVDFALLDGDGNLLENPVHYRDSRTDGMLDLAFSLLGKKRFYDLTGNQFMQINTAFQLLSLYQNRPEIMHRAQTALLMPDYFNYLLCGVKATEYSIASTTQLLDAKARSFSSEVMAALGINEQLFPPVVPSGTVLGQINADICTELAIDPASVVAVCSHDTQSAMLSVPAQGDDFAFLSCGTWSLLGTELASPVINNKAYELNITNEGGYGGKISFLKNIIGLWLVQESRRYWQKEGHSYSFAQLEQMAVESEPFKCFIDPDDPVFVPSGNMPQRVRQYCKNTNQPVPQTNGEVLRCIYESLAFKYKLALNQIESCTGKRYQTLHVVGGGAKDKLLCSMTASALGITVAAGPIEATALGNIAAQLLATGDITSIRHARQIIAASEAVQQFEPSDVSAWAAAFERYKKLTNQEVV